MSKKFFNDRLRTNSTEIGSDSEYGGYTKEEFEIDVATYAYYYFYFAGGLFIIVFLQVRICS